MTGPTTLHPRVPPGLEQRLTAALEARADLVQLEDLTPGRVPAPATPDHPRWRRPLALVAAAAAVVALVAVPVALNGASDEPQPAPQPTPSPPPTQAERAVREGPGREWPVEGRIQVDLDGDSAPDTVRLRVDPAYPETDGARVEAELSSQPDLRPYALLSGSAIGWSLTAEAVEVDGDDGAEVLVERETGSVWVAALVTWVDGSLIGLDTAAEALEPLLRGIRDGRLYGYTVVDGTILSWESQQAYDIRGEGVGLPETYSADAWTWSLEPNTGSRRGRPELVAKMDGPRCVGDAPVPAPGPCGGSGDGGQVDQDVPAFFPRVTEELGIGQELTTETGGGTLTASLRGAGNGLVLAITVGAGATQEVPMPNRLRDPVLMGEPLVGIESPALAVHGDRGGVEEWTVVGFRNGEATVLAPSGEVPLASGVLNDGLAAETWLSHEGVLHTALFAADDAERRSTVHSWLPDAGDDLESQEAGTYCLSFGGDGAEDTARRC